MLVATPGQPPASLTGNAATPSSAMTERNAVGPGRGWPGHSPAVLDGTPYPHLARLLDQLGWLEETCLRSVDPEPGVSAGIGPDGAVAPVNAIWAAASLVHGAVSDSLASDGFNACSFFDALASRLDPFVSPSRLELQIPASTLSVSDCIPAAWWQAILVMHAATQARLQGEVTCLKVTLSPVAAKWQLTITDETGPSLGKASFENAGMLQRISQRLGGVRGTFTGRWGAVVFLRFKATEPSHGLLPAGS